jgi:hypothetical protein
MKRLAAVLVAAWAALPAGCAGKPPPPAKVHVEGRVVRQGRPVAFVMVTFHPQDPGEGQGYQGAAGKDGAFSLECPPGSYTVTLSPLPVGRGNAADPGAGGVVGSPESRGPEGIPRAHRSPSTTPLPLMKIPAGGKKDVVLDVR